jgi:hypothetical protein
VACLIAPIVRVISGAGSGIRLVHKVQISDWVGISVDPGIVLQVAVKRT